MAETKTIEVKAMTKPENSNKSVKWGEGKSDWYRCAPEAHGNMKWGGTYKVETGYDQEGKLFIQKVLETLKEPEKRSWTPKRMGGGGGGGTAEFRTPDEIKRSTAVGVAFSFAAEMKQDANFAFGIADQIKHYIDSGSPF